MASIPQGAFATLKIRASAGKEEKEDWSWGKKSSPKDQFNFTKEILEQPPVKYNGKLMNSIWGQYNKYSVHNFKQLAGDVFNYGQQHPIANNMWTPGVTMSACFAAPDVLGNKSG